MLKQIISETKTKMEQVIEFLKNDLSKISAGMASPILVSAIQINYYDQKTPLNQLASISIPEAKTIVIKPYDKAIVEVIAGAINKEKLGFQGVVDGEIIRITIPSLTEESRKEKVKFVKKEIEKAKIAIRSVRHSSNDQIKKVDTSEDLVKEYQDEVQKLTDEFNKKISEIGDEKEKHILEI